MAVRRDRLLARRSHGSRRITLFGIFFDRARST